MSFFIRAGKRDWATITEPNHFWFVCDWIRTWREIFELIINMTKLLDSDRLTAVHFIFLKQCKKS